jgi:hypothetical protein
MPGATGKIHSRPHPPRKIRFSGLQHRERRSQNLLATFNRMRPHRKRRLAISCAGKGQAGAEYLSSSQTGFFCPAAAAVRSGRPGCVPYWADGSLPPLAFGMALDECHVRLPGAGAAASTDCRPPCADGARTRCRCASAAIASHGKQPGRGGRPGRINPAGRRWRGAPRAYPWERCRRIPRSATARHASPAAACCRPVRSARRSFRIFRSAIP